MKVRFLKKYGIGYPVYKSYELGSEWWVYDWFGLNLIKEDIAEEIL